MSGLKAAYFNELYKLSKKKKIMVATILSLASVAVAGGIVAVVDNFMGIKVTGSATFPILVLSVLSYTLIPLFTAFICIDMFSGEISDQTIKLTLTRPVSRYKIYMSKVMAAASFILGNLLFVLICSLIVSYITDSISVSIFKIILAYAASFLPLLVFSLFVILISNLVRSSTLSFLISVITYLVFITIGTIFTDYQSFLFTSMFDWYTLFLGSYINFQKIFRVLLILAGCGTMLFVTGYYLFDKKDI